MSKPVSAWRTKPVNEPKRGDPPLPLDRDTCEVAPPPSEFAIAFRDSQRTQIVVESAARFQPWVPQQVRREVEAGFGDGTRINVYDDGLAPKIVVWSREGGAVREAEIFRYFPEDLETYRAAGSDEDAARWLAATAAHWNREMRELVEGRGMSPSEASALLREVDLQVLKLILEGAAHAYAMPALLGPKPPIARAEHSRVERPITRTEKIIGTAEDLALEFRKNADGPRTPAQALELAEKYGVRFPDEVEVRFIDDKLAEGIIPNGAYAAYTIPAASGSRVSWETLFDTRTDKILVRVRRSVLESDEAIVGILAHEAHELNALERKLGGDRTISRLQLAKEIHPRSEGGNVGNLHEQAWDVCHQVVQRMREEGR